MAAILDGECRRQDQLSAPASAPILLSRFRRRALACLALFNLILFLTGIIAAHMALRAAESAGLQQTQNVARIVEQHIAPLTDGVDTLRIVAERYVKFRASGQQDAARSVANDIQLIVENSAFHVFQVGIIDRDGTFIWSTLPTAVGANVADRSYFIAHRDGLRSGNASEPLAGRITGRTAILFTRALLDRNGAFDGVAVVSIDLIQMSKALQMPELGAGDVAVLYRTDDGRVLARTPDPTAPLREARTVVVPEAWHGGPGRRGSVDMMGPYSGNRRFVGYATAEHWPIGVLIAANADHLLQNTTRQNQADALVMASISATSFAGYFWLLATRRNELQREALRHANMTLRAADAARAQLNGLLQDANVAIYTMTLMADGRANFTYVSPNVERVLGVPMTMLTALEGPPPWVDERDRPIVVQLRRTAMRDGTAWADFRIHTPQGQMVWANARLRVVARYADGSADIVGCMIDVTEKHRQIEQGAATEKMLALGQMASGLMHELSHPIATILLSVETVLHRAPQTAADWEELGTRLNRIHKQAERAREILQHLGRFGWIDPELLTSFDAGALLVEAHALCADALETDGITMHLSVTPDLPAVTGIPELVEQALVNLINNARDALARRPAGGPAPAIWLDAHGDPGKVEVSVRDNAGGISDEVMPHIFDLFYTTKPSGGGMGLGLALARGYLRSMGGDLAARNIDGGALFTLSLQVKKDQPEGATKAETTGAAVSVKTLI